MSNTQVAKREAQVTDAFQLEIIQNQVADLLGNNSKQMGSFKTKMIQMSMNKMLEKCDPASIINCGLQALTLDLPLTAGQGYIVAYKGVAQLDVGYKGFQVLAKRSGYSVVADAVYKCDLYESTGFGFDVVHKFEPNRSERNAADDKWAKANLDGVLVSIREDETGLTTTKFVEASLIFKIVGMSPSASSEYSPHNKWAEQMFCAKALKSVLSKMAIDLSKASQLNDAIQIINSTESIAQAAPQGLPEYSQSRFDEMWPKWVDIVSTGKRKAVTIITQLVNGFALSESQMQKVMTLSKHEPIEGEVAELKNYADEDFKSDYSAWQGSVESGDITPDSLIESIQTEYKLTQSQLSSLGGLYDCVPVSQEA